MKIFGMEKVSYRKFLLRNVKSVASLICVSRI
jgi:hypothetical protein